MRNLGLYETPIVQDGNLNTLHTESYTIFFECRKVIFKQHYDDIIDNMNMIISLYYQSFLEGLKYTEKSFSIIYWVWHILFSEVSVSLLWYYIFCNIQHLLEAWLPTLFVTWKSITHITTKASKTSPSHQKWIHLNMFLYTLDIHEGVGCYK